MGVFDVSSMGEITFNDGERMIISAALIEAPFPNAFRIAEYPDGSQELQGAYVWSQGSIGGITWKGLPVVQVDEDGLALDE